MDNLDALDAVLGETLEAYYIGDDGTELLLRFENGRILQWSGRYARPLDADAEDLRDIWEERAAGEWVSVTADDEERDVDGD